MPQSNIIPPDCHITTFSRQNNDGWEPTMSFLTSAPAMPCCSKVATSKGPNCSSSSWACAIKVTQTSNYAKLLWNPPLFFSWRGITCTIPATSCACCIAAAILLCANWSETDMVYFSCSAHDMFKKLQSFTISATCHSKDTRQKRIQYHTLVEPHATATGRIQLVQRQTAALFWSSLASLVMCNWSCLTKPLNCCPSTKCRHLSKPFTIFPFELFTNHYKWCFLCISAGLLVLPRWREEKAGKITLDYITSLVMSMEGLSINTSDKFRTLRLLVWNFINQPTNVYQM